MNGIPLKSDCQIRRHVPIRALLKKKLLRHSSARPSGWMLSSRSQLNQDIIQNAQGELTCWPTFDKLRGTHDSFFFPIHFYSNHHNKSKWNQMHHVGEHRHGRVIFINTANKKSRVRRYFSLVLRSLNWACHPAVHPTSGLKIEKKRKTPSIMPPLRMSSLRSRLPWCISVWKGDVRWLEEICMCINSSKHQAEHTII